MRSRPSLTLNQEVEDPCGRGGWENARRPQGHDRKQGCGLSTSSSPCGRDSGTLSSSMIAAPVPAVSRASNAKSMFLDDLAQKTKRGQVGRVKAGRIPGGRCYGYDVVPSIDERGQRTINAKEATIVQRIFSEYIKGHSPLEIVAKLNRELVPSPRGGGWNSSTINGSAKRANENAEQPSLYRQDRFQSAAVH